MPRAAEIYRRAWSRGHRPEPLLSVSEWSDRYRRLSQRASAEPGPWRTSRTPYLRAIMDCLSSSSPIERVVFMKGAQIGATEAGNNWLGYIMHQAPGPVMAVAPTVELAKRGSKQRLDPLIEESPALRGLVAPARSRDSGNTVLSKDFPGGVLILTGANSAAGLRSMPVRYLFLDEVDAYPPDADGEGDPVGLAIKRTATFARRKVFMVSTPTIAGVSRIEAAYEESDQRRYFVPCPECSEMQVLRWQQVQWPKGEPDKARYACEHCGALIPNERKGWMLEHGEWRATAEGDGKTAGFHLSALYSPPGWYGWPDAARDFLAAGKNPNRLKVFVNTVLGETFRESGEAPDWQRLYERREDYPIGRIPAGALYLTAGADVQKDRIEVEVVGWGRRQESWSIEHRVLHGDPTQSRLWGELTAVLNQAYENDAGGVLHIGKLAIDTGGHWTTEVYSWVSRQPPGRVMAVKGVDTTSYALGAAAYVEVNQAGRKLRRGARLWPVGVSLLKSQLYGWLRQDAPLDGEPAPDGFCHFPRYPEEYFKQLTAERLVRRQNRNGFVKLEWELTRDRNEALDMRLYAMAAAIAARVDRWAETDWQAAETALGVRCTASTTAAPDMDEGHLPRPARVPSRWVRAHAAW